MTVFQKKSQSRSLALAVAGLTVFLGPVQQLLADDEGEKTRDEQISAHVQRLAETERAEKFEHMLGVIGDVDRVCVLSEPQRKAMELAAKGAVDKYIDNWRTEMDTWVRNRVRHARGDLTIFLEGMGTVHFGDANEWAPERQEVWIRSVSNALTEDQAVAYQKDLDERAEFKHRAMANVLVADVDRVVRMTQEQREQLLPLVLESAEENWKRLQAANGSGELLPAIQQMGAMLSGIEPEKLTEFLNETQLKRWNIYLENHAASWRMLRNLNIDDFQLEGLRIDVDF